MEESMTTFTAIAIDPGETSGWGMYRAQRIVTPDGASEWYDEKFTCGELGPHDHYNQLETLLELQESQEYHIICESFEFRNTGKHRDNLVLVSLEYIGVVKLFCQKHSYPANMQTASQGKITKKSFVRKENLQRLGLWDPRLGHAMDGYGHLLQWMINGPLKRKDFLAIGWPNV